jgi:hypothetical protein
MGEAEEESSGDAWRARRLSGGHGEAACYLPVAAWPAKIERKVAGVGWLLGQKPSGPMVC